MEDKIISVLNNVRTNLSNELETKRKELVKPFDDFADRLSAVEVAPLKIRGLSIEEIDNNFENISVEILEKLEMYKELSKLSFYPLTDEQKLDISNIMKELIKEINEIKKYIVENHATAVDDVTLTDDTLEYVESQLSALNFYETFDKDITSAVISIVTTTFISAICSSISLMGVFVSVVPLFVYECTGLIQTAVLARLQYSFSGRYAVRTGIYIDNM